MAEIIPPNRGTRLDTVDQRIGAYFENIARLAVMENDGTPEGVVNARKTRFCLDITNDILYIKTTDYGTLTGWVALN